MHAFLPPLSYVVRLSHARILPRIQRISGPFLQIHSRLFRTLYCLLPLNCPFRMQDMFCLSFPFSPVIIKISFSVYTNIKITQSLSNSHFHNGMNAIRILSTVSVASLSFVIMMPSFTPRLLAHSTSPLASLSLVFSLPISYET